MDKCDFVILHLNFPGYADSFTSLRKFTPPEVIGKVILIDQSGQRPDHPEVDEHIRIEHIGFSGACNLGIERSTAPYVALVSDDVVFINNNWWDGVLETFNQITNAVCVNPWSPNEPDGKGGSYCPTSQTVKTDFTDDLYKSFLKPWVIDGIMIWAGVMRRDLLDKMPGVVPGRAWFDEWFYPVGGEDYDFCRRAYMAKMRVLGSYRSVVWHHWHKSLQYETGLPGLKASGQFHEKWGSDADIYGDRGRMDIPMCQTRERKFVQSVHA